MAPGLFGRHIGDGTDHISGARQVLADGFELGVIGVVGGFEKFGQAEVEKLDVAILGDHDVRGFEIAMSDPVAVRVRKGLGYGHGVSEPFLEGENLTRNGLVECLALEQLHHEKWGSLVLTNLVDDRDVGMRERGGGLGLPLESQTPLRVGGEGRRQDLDRDVTP